MQFKGPLSKYIIHVLLFWSQLNFEPSQTKSMREKKGGASFENSTNGHFSALGIGRQKYVPNASTKKFIKLFLRSFSFDQSWIRPNFPVPHIFTDNNNDQQQRSQKLSLWLLKKDFSNDWRLPKVKLILEWMTGSWRPRINISRRRSSWIV